MSKRNDLDFILDIKESIDRISMYAEGFDYKTFCQDFKIQDAIIRIVEILGEVVKQLSTNIKEINSDIQWKKIAGQETG